MDEQLFINPIRCQSCGDIIGHIWKYYHEQLHQKGNLPIRTLDDNKLLNVEKTKEGLLLDRLGVYKYCCRINIMTRPGYKQYE